jgi:hypothetical protein
MQQPLQKLDYALNPHGTIKLLSAIHTHIIACMTPQSMQAVLSKAVRVACARM